MPGLAGVTVMVTRPEQQAAPLCALLAAAGANIVALPVLQISAVDAAAVPAASAVGTDAFDCIIFTSANAVHYGASLVSGQDSAAFAAIGPATARAMQQHGVAATVTPRGGFDSEHLLLHPRLEHPRGQRILIIKGRQGRELLQQQLAHRGAVVEVAEVYQRSQVVYSDDQLTALAARFAAGGIDIITATSVDVVTALVALATSALRREFDRVHWLVPGVRVAKAVRGHGIKAPLIQARSADDHDLLDAIVRWDSSIAGTEPDA